MSVDYATTGDLETTYNNVPFDSVNGIPLLLDLDNPTPYGLFPIPGPNCGDIAHGSSASIGSFASSSTKFADTSDTMGMSSSVHVGGQPIELSSGSRYPYYEEAWAADNQQTMTASIDPPLSATSESVSVTVNYTQNEPSEQGTAFFIFDISQPNGGFACADTTTAPTETRSGSFSGGDEPGSYEEVDTFGCPSGHPIVDSSGGIPTMQAIEYQFLTTYNGGSESSAGSWTINDITATVS